MCFALDGRYLGHDEAMAAGAAWLLEQIGREPTADEAAYLVLWKWNSNEGNYFCSFAHRAMMQ